ncbi:MAG: DUF4982 domain-containing protein [Candidatus Gastranaerophilales bacterium]|nr:DUF4982 domain-containing protein [Candidatus Gastranaerophilales bacterium]
MRKTIDMNENWKFCLGDLAPQSDTEGWGGAKAKGFGFGVAAQSFDDTKWREVDLPHDFVSEGEYTRKTAEKSDMQDIPEMESIDSRHFAGGCLEGGVAWYRKRFMIPADCEEKRVHLFFDGIYRNSTVYLNEYLIGTHSGGYDSFYYDVTDFVNMGGENVLAVRVDASGREGWWYEGGGIYRDVHIEIKEPIAVAPYGVFVSPRVDLNDRTADIAIKTEVWNKLFTDQKVTVQSMICDAEGNVIAKTAEEILVEAWEEQTCVQKVELRDVRLWDLDDTYLYRLTTDLIVDGAPADSVDTDFGIRDIYFDADKGFYLNGKNRKIKGLCCHQDHAGVGIAMDKSIFQYRLEQMKRMGANAYRSAHHMMTSQMLDLCDRMGMLVFDETRRMSSAVSDLEALRTMVRHGRNHPSVFLWGIGNEEVFSQDRPETARTTRTMKAEIGKLDGTRPVTAAVVCWNGKERFDTAANYVDVTGNLDIMGFNYCKQAWDDYHERMPKQPVIITEASANSGTRGCYSTDEKSGQYYILDADNAEKVQNRQKAVKKDLAEDEWRYFARREYLSGIFLWTGFDYRGEQTPLGYPAVYSQFGIFDYCGFPKDNLYYYKSWWTDKPILHLFPHWNFTGQETVTVYCYSNLDEVELFVNGKSYGRKTMEKNWYLSWDDVRYEKGVLKAVGYQNGESAMEEIVTTTGEAYRIELIPYRSEIADKETAIVNAVILDADGLVVPTADQEICFEVEGGKFLGTGNGNPGDHASEKAPARRAFHGLCQALVKADKKDIKMTAKADGLVLGVCEIKVLRR